MFWVLMAFLALGIAFGLIYPTLAIVYYKIRYRKSSTLRAILKEIGW